MEYEQKLSRPTVSEVEIIEDARNRAVQEAVNLNLELQSVLEEIKNVERETNQLQLGRDDNSSRPLKYRRISPTPMDPSVPLRRAVPQSAEQQAQDQDNDDDEGVWFIPTPSTSIGSSRPQANVSSLSDRRRD